jgi:Zn-dependent protease
MTATEAPTTATFPCPRCGTLLPQGAVACHNCGALVYAQRLNEIAAEALREEAANPVRAAMVWQQALPLLPPASEQYRAVASRIGALSAQMGPPPPGLGGTPATSPAGAGPTYVPDYAPPPAVPRRDPFGVAVLKTAGSMLLSIVVYAYLTDLRWAGATGFTLLMLIHELGHSMAIKYFGLSASPPIFIPFLGAMINLRQPPRNAFEEAIVGIAGPVTGTIAAGVTYLLYLKTGQILLLDLAYFGFLLNLFNLLPVPPLDGGRVTAAVSPWIWIPGLLIAVLWVVKGFMQGRPSYILILLLLYAWPRVRQVLAQQGHRSEYYAISRSASFAIGAAYVTLGLFLLAMFMFAGYQIHELGGGGIGF